MEQDSIKVLIVDDSAIVRAMIKEIMESDMRFSVAGSAENGEKAIQKNRELSPDLIVMDINMPVMDGIQATKSILEESNPAIVAFTTEDTVKVGYKCIEAGALEIIQKPDFSVMTTEVLQDFCERLAQIAYGHKSQHGAVRKLTLISKDAPLAGELKTESEKTCTSWPYDLCVIGASTGGPAAVQTVLQGLGPDFPVPILIAQHIDSLFDQQFTTWLNDTTGMSVELAKDGETPLPGHAYVAPANKHLIIGPGRFKSSECTMILSDDPPVHFLKPAVDKLFESAADIFGPRLIAVLLTGMGKDGAEGCKAVVDNGGFTIAESEESCVVFGMPKAAIELEAARTVRQLGDIAGCIKAKFGI